MGGTHRRGGQTTHMVDAERVLYSPHTLPCWYSMASPRRWLCNATTIGRRRTHMCFHPTLRSKGWSLIGAAVPAVSFVGVRGLPTVRGTCDSRQVNVCAVRSSVVPCRRSMRIALCSAAVACMRADPWLVVLHLLSLPQAVCAAHWGELVRERQ